MGTFSESKNRPIKTMVESEDKTFLKNSRRQKTPRPEFKSKTFQRIVLQIVYYKKVKQELEEKINPEVKNMLIVYQWFL